MARRRNSSIEAQTAAATYRAALELVGRIQPVWVNSMTPDQAAAATKAVIVTTLEAVSNAAQESLALDGE